MKRQVLNPYLPARINLLLIMSLPNNIMVLSANCQGLRTYKKRIDVLSYMKETGASIVCLQDTHLTEKEINSVKQIWPECYVHGVRNNSRVWLFF